MDRLDGSDSNCAGQRGARSLGLRLGRGLLAVAIIGGLGFTLIAHGRRDGGDPDLLVAPVEVPAGAHLVEMRYRPRSVAVGLGVSALGLITLVTLAVPRARRRSDVAAATGGELPSPAPELRSR